MKKFFISGFWTSVLFTAVFLLVPKNIEAETIRVSGFSYERNVMPLVGFVPVWWFEEDPATHLRSKLLDPANFGQDGKVACGIDLRPFVSTVSDGFLITGDEKNYDVFFAGMIDSDLTETEADEIVEFMRAGGIVYVSGGGYSSYQGLGIPVSDGVRHNRLFEKLGIADRFQDEVIDFYFCGNTTVPSNTAVVKGSFGDVGSFGHSVFNPINTASLQSVATGYDQLCMIGTFAQTETQKLQSAQSGDYERTILAEGRFGKGYLSVSGEPLYLWTDYDENRLNYFLNLFALACPDGSSPSIEPFLDLPWDYEAKGLSFSEAALAIGSYFDHEYPFVDVGSVLGEPEEAKGSVTNYENKFRDTKLQYSGHDGYDWLGPAKVKNGDAVLAAAAGTAQYFKAGKGNGACGTSACGNAIVIDHGNGYQSRYYHLQDNDPVAESFETPKHVSAREVIGKVGSTGTKSTAPHIHFSVIQDKNGDGNFQDNRPDGLTDPFGWQSKEPDPWPLYTFNFRGSDRSGNTSNYLWIKPIANLSREIPANGGYFRLEKFGVNFPSNSFASATISMKHTSGADISETLERIGATLSMEVIDASGNPISEFPDNFTLTVDLNDFDISRYKVSSISIYSSADGENWTKENTQVDLAAGTATANLNHASYFTLAGEKNDTTSPTTTATISGQKGEDGWFRSDVNVSLMSLDNEGGSGVNYIGYKVNDNYFNEYSTPFVVTGAGEHTVQFYSVDNYENTEEGKSVTFYIDQTPPELKVRFNKEILATEFVGHNSNDSVEAINSDTVNLTDKAGNKTKIWGSFNLSGVQNSFNLQKISYNNLPATVFEKNSYFSEYKSYPDGKLISISQTWTLKNMGLLSNTTTNYRTNIESTRVRVKEGANVITDSWITGQHLLWIETNNGSLKYGYE